MRECDRFGGEWSDEEIARFRARAYKLLDAGLKPNDAEDLAERLLYRDRPGSGDDRRICMECTRLSQDGYCRAARQLGASKDYMPVKTMLQRCEKFQPRG